MNNVGLDLEQYLISAHARRPLQSSPLNFKGGGTALSRQLLRTRTDRLFLASHHSRRRRRRWREMTAAAGDLGPNSIGKNFCPKSCRKQILKKIPVQTEMEGSLFIVLFHPVFSRILGRFFGRIFLSIESGPRPLA